MSCSIERSLFLLIVLQQWSLQSPYLTPREIDVFTQIYRNIREKWYKPDTEDKIEEALLQAGRLTSDLKVGAGIDEMREKYMLLSPQASLF
ncbi:MAG: hypothetical protein DRP87_19130 [Spirochaetes bacterium]|nr:MAG: hypothetical protein DRP87_19130 [Spirochaetota bacterium]